MQRIKGRFALRLPWRGWSCGRDFRAVWLAVAFLPVGLPTARAEAQPPANSDSECRGGLLPPTDEERAWMRANCPPIRDVQLNSMGLQRVRDNAGGVVPLAGPSASPVEFGREFVTAAPPLTPFPTPC